MENPKKLCFPIFYQVHLWNTSRYCRVQISLKFEVNLINRLGEIVGYLITFDEMKIFWEKHIFQHKTVSSNWTNLKRVCLTVLEIFNENRKSRKTQFPAFLLFCLMYSRRLLNNWYGENFLYIPGRSEKYSKKRCFQIFPILCQTNYVSD